MLTFKGKYWKIPAGATPWDLETTVKYGKGVENGMLTSVGVVPKPLQKPYPPVFLPFASSPNSIRWAAQEGVTAILPPMHEAYESPLFDLYAEVSGKPRGQGTGLLRDVIIADTDDEAMALWEDSGAFLRQGVVRAVWLPPRPDGPGDQELCDCEGINRPRLRAGRHR